MALGAPRSTVVADIVRGAMLMAVTGIVLGVGSAIALTRLLRGWLFQVSPVDTTTLAMAALLIVITTLVASALPALRGANVDPSLMLRGE